MVVKVQDDDDGEVKGDMTPMIDIIFLLLIFFILTTKFVPDEKFIASILPTNKGQASTPSEKIEPPEDINILVYPINMPRSKQPSWYDNAWKDKREARSAFIRIGSSEPIEISGTELSLDKNRARVDVELDRAHGYVFNELEKREQNSAARKDEDPVVIHCFSGLPWKYAILVYDAVRDYERTRTGRGANSPEELLVAREVNFAPPRIRDYHTWELGNELFEIVHKK